MIPYDRRYPIRGWPWIAELLREGHGVMSLWTPDLGWRHFAIDDSDFDRNYLLPDIEARRQGLWNSSRMTSSS